jgi:hypothetical protein
LVRWVNENAFASIVQARPCPTFGRPVHLRGSPIDYGPVVLRMPFGFHLAMDTLPSEQLTSFSGQRGITPAFGYGPPHPSARRTSTFLNNTLLSTHDGTVRLLQHVHVRRAVCGLRGPAWTIRPRRAGDLPVLVPVVSQRARVLRLRRTAPSTRDNVVAGLPSSSRNGAGVLFHRLFEAPSPGPPIPLSTLQATPRHAACKTRGQDGFAALLSRRALSSPTTCRFIPALSE